MTKAVILAGGLGTRLAEETVTKPKPMVEIGGKPILWHLMKFYAAHGVKEFIVCAGYKQEYIKQFFAAYHRNGSDTTFDLASGTMTTHSSEDCDWKVTVVNTGDTTQTGGRLKRIRDYVGSEPFCMTYGDGLSDVDITAELAAHKKSGCLVTLAGVRPPPRFGEVDIVDGKVVRFMEKMARAGGRINGGFMVIDPKALDYVADDSTAWEVEPMRKLAAEGQINAFEHDGFWQCMDNIREKELLQELWDSGKAPWENLGMNTITPSFWQGKKVFVTGHTGFKGSWLAEILLTLGAEVTGYALAPPSDPSHFDVLGLGGRIHKHHLSDIRDRAALNKAMAEAQPDIVFHLAAQPIVRRSYADPVETFETNIMGTVGVLDAVRLHAPQCRAIVSITSDKCYLNEDHGRPFAEDDRLGGQDPYSASKAGAEVAAEAYEFSYFQHTRTALATVRAGNVIGGGDWAADRLIPDVTRAARDKKPVVIRSPKATRPWQHVLEPLRGYMMMAEKLWDEGHAFRGGWNFGPAVADAQPVSTVLTELQRTLPFELQLDTAPQPHEALLLSLDISKAEKKLGWTPMLRLSQALDLTGAWYQAHIDGGDTRALTQKQIRDYLGLT